MRGDLGTLGVILRKVGGSQIYIKEGEKEEEGMNDERNVTLSDFGLIVCL